MDTSPDKVARKVPTYHVGGLVPAAGVVQLVTAVVLSGAVFGSALFLCAVLLGTVGIVLLLLHHREAPTSTPGWGWTQVMNRLLVLRRSALDYSLTLSIAQSEEYKQTQSHEVATMALKDEEALRNEQERKRKLLVDMMPLPTTDALTVEGFSANVEPKQVLLPLKVQHGDIMHEKMTQERPTSTVRKTLATQGTKATHVQVQAKSTQSLQKIAVFEASSKVSGTIRIQLPAVLPESKPKVNVPVVLPVAHPVVELPKSTIEEVVSPAITVNAKPIASAVAPLPVFPELKPLVEVAHGEAAIERDLVVTRKVLLYLNPNIESVMDLKEQDVEQEAELEQGVELEDKPDDFALSLEAFPPLSPLMVPQKSMLLPTTDVVEPNFLMDIELEPISKQEKKLATPSSLHLESVGNVDLRSMMDELDAMRLELDAAMACCTLLLHEGEKTSDLHDPRGQTVSAFGRQYS